MFQGCSGTRFKDSGVEVVDCVRESGGDVLIIQVGMVGVLMFENYLVL